MRQAAAFEGGLMLVVGEICEVMGGGITVQIPLKSLRKMLEGIPLEVEGVRTVRSWHDQEYEHTLSVTRDEAGFTFGLRSERGAATLGMVYRNDSVNLKDLVFPRYTYPAGFDFPPSQIAEEPEEELVS